MKTRLTALVLILVIILMAVYLKDSREPDPPVPSKKWAVPLEQKDTYVIFLSGLNSQSDGTPYNHMGFTYLRHQFTRVGLSFQDQHFLKYSYQGGQVKKGRWYPNPYKPKDTGQPIQFSVLYLKDMIEEFSLHHPGARFLLVGHSLGGRIAFDYATQYHQNESGLLKGIVTLNAPLLGSPYTHTDILSLIRPVWGSIAVKQLAAEYQLRNELSVAKIRANAARKLIKKGIHLATFGTKQDFVVDPLTACLVDKHGHPLTEGEIISMNLLSGTFDGHMQILKQEQVANYIISVYTCPAEGGY